MGEPHGGGVPRPNRGGDRSGIARYWYPLVALVRRDMQKRYATTALGLGWTVVQPLILIGVYILVFAFILNGGRTAESAHAFVFFMLTGMLPYLATTEGIQRASTALREDRALFDREAFPGEVVPAARVVGAAVGELAALVLVVIIGSVFFALPFGGWLLTLPLLVALRVIITCGFAWIVSILTVFVTDLAEVLSLLLTAWLFLTPIFYPADAVPGAIRWILVLNPLHHIVEAYRSVLLEGHAPIPEALFLVAWGVVIGGAGVWFFRKALDRAKDFL